MSTTSGRKVTAHEKSPTISSPAREKKKGGKGVNMMREEKKEGNDYISGEGAQDRRRERKR